MLRRSGTMGRVVAYEVVTNLKPKIGHVHANLAKARELCRKIQPQSLDLLCFPEMIFTGYVFENAAAISPHLEHPKTGPTSLFCADLAKKLDCYVIAGYPEVLSDEETSTTGSTMLAKDSQTTEAQNHNAGEHSSEILQEIQSKPVGANSAALYSPGGEWLGGYRKSHLFDTDKTWCKAGPGFKSFHLPPPLNITLSLGICMDLNPQIPEWTLSTGPYEMADYCIEQKANLLVLLNAWLDSNKEMEESCDWGTLNYWAARLRPLWVKEGGSTGSDDEDRDEKEEDKRDDEGRETIVVVCNRTGDENGKTFAGSSSIYSMHAGSGRPKLLDAMGRKEEGVRVWNIQLQADEPRGEVETRLE